MTVSATTAIGEVSRIPSHYRARYYNPTTGRFLSEDPMGFAGSGANLYAYANENPVSLKDAFGTCPWTCEDADGANLLISLFVALIMVELFFLALLWPGGALALFMLGAGGAFTGAGIGALELLYQLLHFQACRKPN